MSLLEVKDLKVSFGGIEALKGISFKVDEGAIVTLIGANGAGKSTTLRAITGLVRGILSILPLPGAKQISGILHAFLRVAVGFIDEVIMPHSTRKRIAVGLRKLRNKALENPWKKHDNIPL